MTGGIARFARKPSAAAATTAASAVIEHKEAAAEETVFGGFVGDDNDASFGGSREFGDFDRDNASGGDDDFGFMGGGDGGGDSSRGNAEFMGDAGLNADGGGFGGQEGAFSGNTTSRGNTGGGGIGLFQSRHLGAHETNDTMQTGFASSAAAPFAVTPIATSNAQTLAGGEAMRSTPRDYGGTPMTLFANRPLRPAVTPNVIFAQTPDGRVVPMAHPPLTTALVTTPRGSCGGDVQARDTPSPVTATPGGGVTRTMPPPPARRPTVTPTTVAAIPNRRQNSTAMAGSLLFGPDQQQPTHHPHEQGGSDAANLPEPDGNDDGFHQVYQQFTVALRDFHDKESHYTETLLDGTVKLDLATAMLLRIKCDVYDLTDSLMTELNVANESIQTIGSTE